MSFRTSKLSDVCPDPTELLELAANGDLEHLESHLDICGECQNVLDASTYELPEIARLRQVAKSVSEADTKEDREWNAATSTFDAPGDPGARTMAMVGSTFPEIPGYEIERVLGSGGLGIVYLARDVSINRQVAIKTLTGGLLAGPERIARLQREAEVLGRLQHPNIVTVFDVGEAHGTPYLTLEYVSGGSLAAKRTGAPWPVSASVRFVSILARAVEQAHSYGVVHRDLKPANILLHGELGPTEANAWDCTPKIADFGIAKELETSGLTLTGQAIGTPSYMAPEQTSPEFGAISAPTDVYALGTLLYELLTGRPPFRAETSAQTIQALLTQDPVSITLLNPKVPRDLVVICNKCLEKKTDKRYDSAAALAEDLDCFLNHRPIQARPAPLHERIGKWARRRPGVAVAALVSTVAVLMLVFQWWQFTSDLQVAKREATEAAERATKNLSEIRRTVKKYMLNVRADEQLEAAGLRDHRVKMIEDALALYVDTVAETNDPQLLIELSQIHKLLAEIANGEKALSHAEQSIELASDLVSSDPTHFAYVTTLAEALTMAGARYAKARDYPNAKKRLLEGIVALEEVDLSDQNVSSVDNRHFVLASAQLYYGQCLEALGQESEAAVAYEQAIHTASLLRGLTDHLWVRSRIYAQLGGLLLESDLKAAREHTDAALKNIRKTLRCSAQRHSHYRRQLGESLLLSARIDEANGDIENALQQARKARCVFRRLCHDATCTDEDQASFLASLQLLSRAQNGDSVDIQNDVECLSHGNVPLLTDTDRQLLGIYRLAGRAGDRFNQHDYEASLVLWKQAIRLAEHVATQSDEDVDELFVWALYFGVWSAEQVGDFETSYAYQSRIHDVVGGSELFVAYFAAMKNDRQAAALLDKFNHSQLSDHQLCKLSTAYFWMALYADENEAKQRYIDRGDRLLRKHVQPRQHGNWRLAHCYAVASAACSGSPEQSRKYLDVAVSELKRLLQFRQEFLELHPALLKELEYRQNGDPYLACIRDRAEFKQVFAEARQTLSGGKSEHELLFDES